MDRPPTVEQLVGCKLPVSGLDERRVVQHFLGKSQDEARLEYQKHGCGLTEDFAYMAADGLRYYLPPAFDYLQSEQSRNDFEFCHGLLCSLCVQSGVRTPPPTDVLNLMKEVARYSDTHRDKFGLAAEEELFDEYVRTIFGT